LNGCGLLHPSYNDLPHYKGFCDFFPFPLPFDVRRLCLLKKLRFRRSSRCASAPALRAFVFPRVSRRHPSTLFLFQSRHFLYPATLHFTQTLFFQGAFVFSRCGVGSTPSFLPLFTMGNRVFPVSPSKPDLAPFSCPEAV